MTPEAAPATQKLAMPDKIDLVREAIARFDTAGKRSQLLALDTATLEDLGLWLADREMTVRQAWVDLNKALGVDVTNAAETESVDIRAVYRFAENYRAIYEQVRAEHARRLARLTVAAVTDGNSGGVDSMARVTQARLVELLAEKLVSTNSLDELTGAHLAGTIATVQGWVNAGLKQQEIALKVADAERKAADSEARRAELQTRIDALPARIKAIEARLDEAEQARAKGKSIPPELFRSIRQELIAMAPGIAPAPGNGSEAAK